MILRHEPPSVEQLAGRRDKLDCLGFCLSDFGWWRFLTIEMNLTDSLKLLRAYADRGDEAAFRQLVESYLDLVYSTAVRRVGGDAKLAEDVTQTVFADLARKARALREVELLGGWLHRHTGFVAANLVRSEQRRRVREQEVVQMNALNDPPDSGWQHLAAELDETIESLETPERQVILLRFFERRDFRAIGQMLGVSDDAAQKRVSRALEKLRELLAHRGVTLEVALLGALLSGKAIKAAPAGLAAKVASLALASAAAGSGLTLAVNTLTHSLWLKTAVVGVVVVATVWLLLANHATRRHPAASPNPVLTLASAAETAESPRAATPVAATAAAGKAGAVSNELVLTVVADDVGQAVPNVIFDYWLWTKGGVKHAQPLYATRFGRCEVPVPADTTELLLVSECDGFASTRLDWRPDRGEKIPGQYTLRLARAVSIGGLVVDSDGNPVAGAQVGFNNQTDAGSETRPQSDEFGWPFWVTATTDAQGRWQIERIGRAAIRTLYGSASHPDFVASPLVFAGRNPNFVEQLMAKTNVFVLGRAVSVRGVVKDPNGQPVPAAEVRVGQVGEGGARESTTMRDGTFAVAGCRPGTNLITAQAQGYAPVTLTADLTDQAEPIQLTLRPGQLLKLRVVDPAGNPLPDATVWLNPFDYADPAKAATPTVQIDFNQRTDASGRLEWNTAPDQELPLEISAAGYMKSGAVHVWPDGVEHVITLQPALSISGTVRDATTGRPVPHFRIITGWPTLDPIDHSTNAHWSSLDRFWMTFGDGKFQHNYEEPVVGGTAHPEFIFKFEAEGYAPFITRSVSAADRHVRFDVDLTPAPARTVTVTLPDGTPAAAVDVGLVTPGAALRLLPGGISSENAAGGSRLVTDEHGRFKLPPDSTIQRVVAANAQGFAEATPAELAVQPVICLQPWGRLEGTLSSNGQPLVDAVIHFEYSQASRGSLSCDSSMFRFKTDTAGRFTFGKVPAGTHHLERVVPVDGSQQVWTVRPLQAVTIQAGETTVVTVEDDGDSH